MEDNIKVGRSQGGTCFKCEQPIRPGDRVIQFSFNVNLVITKHRVSENAHLVCAEEFAALLGRRISEAFKRG